MVDIFAMTLKVISRPFNIELLRFCHFVGFLQLVLDNGFFDADTTQY